MNTGDKNPNPFLNVGDFSYISKLQLNDVSQNKIIDELIAAQFGEATLAAYLTVMKTGLETLIGDRVAKSGLTADLPAGGYKITGLADATNATDAVNRQTAIAIAAGGGAVSEIPITELGIGSATAFQLIRINAAGTAVEGYDFSDSWLPPEDSDFNLIGNKKQLVDTTANDVDATIPASPTIGHYYVISNAGAPDSYLYVCNVLRNGNVINYAGKNIDADDDGNLILKNGDTVYLVCDATNQLRIL